MKGQAEMLIILGVYFVLIVVLFSYVFGNSTVDTRNALENNLLFSGTKLETYVRSFLQALKLSLLQSIYDAGNSYADKNWQCYSNSLGSSYGNCLSGSCSIGSIAGDILNGASNYVNNYYLAAYALFSANSNSKVVVPSTIGSPSLWSINNNGIGVRWPDTSFTLSDTNVQINRKFTPETQISTVFTPMYDASKGLILNDMLWYNANKIAIEEEHSPKIVNCNSYSCSYGTVTLTKKCGPSDAKTNACGNVCPISNPTAEEVFSSNYGKSISDAQNGVKAKINVNLDNLQGQLSTNLYKFEFTDRNPQSYIYPNDDKTDNVDGGYCNKKPVQTDSCAQCCIPNPCCTQDTNGNCVANSCCTLKDCGQSYTTDCNFKFYSSVQTKVDVTETAYPKYALYQGQDCSYCNSRPTADSKVDCFNQCRANIGVAQDHLHLKYTITSGNGPSLIGCSVWTR